MIRISSDIEIYPDTNEVMTMADDHVKHRTKVEPRIMHVLQILMNNSPQVVSREQLIDEVWDNYGGADDALNQAISHLRKVLNDTNKNDRIIETVVKKGYRFTGELGVNYQSSQEPNHKFRLSTRWIALIAIVMLFLLFVIYWIRSSESYVPKAPMDKGTPYTTNEPVPKSDRE
ncbi:DNA-binding winged helix-turn-helix (wHTH) domain-containing protein [Reichenbachiella faecimaris]|uniref:DNA-binding winged helix-turn-helix (WHTH) domain-containing protein n=1 Tax=Reichenbachiella faecimaris TaxID=692418 RepID=A0A1W2G6F3_REIFA|nr:helix-turn-helix domain-containing protein [Reichenbachiella faecimaris]SMD32257.1 DNA-binding winged helix-turn-helix (wHTH) domain-containing protein [Reichenbachiella faecimaris]